LAALIEGTNVLWFLFALLAVCAYVWMYHRRRLSQFDNLDETEIARFVRLLFDSGYNGATMVISDMTADRFVQFRKYIRQPGDIGIEAHFPSAPWSKPYYNLVAELLRKRGKDFEVLTTNTRPTTELMRIDFGSDVAQAIEWAIEVFGVVFGCHDIRARVRADDIDPRNARIKRSSDSTGPSV
jgi:hypothetical protein